MTISRWHQDEQDFLAKLEQQCNTYQEYHNRDHLYYSKLASKFNIPILIISAINALTAVALNEFVDQKYVSIMNAVLSAGTGVLGSIQLYMKITEKTTNALRASILMKRLALKISKELSIDMENRVTDGQAFLADCFSEFNTALEQGNPIEKKLYNHMAFTEIPIREKQSLLNMAAAVVSGSPRKSIIDFSSSENLERLEDSRAKRLWGFAGKVQKVSRFPHGSSSPSRLTGSTPEAGTPEERDVELAVRGS